MTMRTLKRATNLDGVTYLPGEKVDDEVFTNPKLYEAPDEPEDDDEGEGGSKDPADTAPAKKAAAKKSTAKKSASSSS